MRVNLTVNGERRVADGVWEGESLLYVLRERLGLPGAKNACEQGECGSCTVYLDEVTVCACLVAAGQAEGREVRTVEGLAAGGPEDAAARSPRRAPQRAAGAADGALDAPAGLDPVQQAFLEAGAVQCGFCTPGLVVQAHDLIRRTRGVPSEEEIREALAGNLCRCTGYQKIIDAVRLAAARTPR
jgi:Aerobic-type carbon monoxide dehydrogenase, small subunit CoxS/CutS homologs